MRVALYYAPQPDDPLWTAGTTWLGRDPVSGASLSQPELCDIAAVTADARRYGFHATLKPPMRLREGATFEHVEAAARDALRDVAAFELPPLAVADLHGFLALRETATCPPLHALADLCVACVDEFRRAPDAAELTQRRGRFLSPEREAMLLRWGYPDVFATWCFHMTLTRRLAAAEKALYEPAATSYLATSLRAARRVEDVCLFIEDEPGAAFRVAGRIPLGQPWAEPGSPMGGGKSTTSSASCRGTGTRY